MSLSADAVFQPSLSLSLSLSPPSPFPSAAPPAVRIYRYWKSLKNLLGSLINSIEAIISLLVLLFLFLGIFALLGTQVFGGKFPMRKLSGRGAILQKPRANFESFANSLYTVFQVQQGDPPSYYLIPRSVHHSLLYHRNCSILD